MMNHNISNQQQKQNPNTIAKLFQALDMYTADLQKKVDLLLDSQQKQFANAYYGHMQKLKDAVKQMEQEIIKHKQKINFYENQGQLATLLKKNMKLQEEMKRLYLKLAEKDRHIKDLDLQISIQKKEGKRLQEKLKTMMRQKLNKSYQYQNSISITHQNNETQKNETIMFATQISPVKSQERMSKLTTQQHTTRLKDKNHTETAMLNAELIRLQRMNKDLKRKNIELMSVNSKFFEKNNKMQNFFYDVVSQLKKSIAVRRNLKECTLQDFKKQDKFQLLIQILSSQMVIEKLHKAIFGQKHDYAFNFIDTQNIKKRVRAKSIQSHHLPAINTSRQN